MARLLASHCSRALRLMIRRISLISSASRSADSNSSSIIAEARNLMAEEAARCRVRVEVDVDGNLPLVAFDRVQIQQVLINLMRNGIDAMESVATDRVLRMSVRQNDDVVLVEVIDRGQGVEFPDKVFEPFFTTRSQGTGLGLYLAREFCVTNRAELGLGTRREPDGSTRSGFLLRFDRSPAQGDDAQGFLDTLPLS